MIENFNAKNIRTISDANGTSNAVVMRERKFLVRNIKTHAKKGCDFFECEGTISNENAQWLKSLGFGIEEVCCNITDDLWTDISW